MCRTNPNSTIKTDLFKGLIVSNLVRVIGSVFLMLCSSLLFVNCDIMNIFRSEVETYTVIYHANQANSGNVPIDVNRYREGQEVIVQGNTGNLIRDGFTFAGWNTQADGDGAGYADEASFTMGAAGVTLYAQWEADNQTLSFDANMGTGTMGPLTVKTGASIDLPENEFEKSGCSFAGWNTQADGEGTTYQPDDTFIILEHVVLYAQWKEIVEGVYAIGDTGPAGGIIFYIDEANEFDWMYLEAAPYGWHNGKDDPLFHWAGRGIATGATSWNIGAGKENTETIIAVLKAWRDDYLKNTWQTGMYEPDIHEVPIRTDLDLDDVSNWTDEYAARVCALYEINGYDSWFLPSIHELNLMYENLYRQGLGGFDFEFYWSSSEDLSTLAWTQYFDTGFRLNNPKGSDFRVRPIRAF